ANRPPVPERLDDCAGHLLDFEYSVAQLHSPTILPLTGFEPMLRSLSYCHHGHPPPALARSSLGSSRSGAVALSLFTRITNANHDGCLFMGSGLQVECAVCDLNARSGL